MHEELSMRNMRSKVARDRRIVHKELSTLADRCARPLFSVCDGCVQRFSWRKGAMRRRYFSHCSAEDTAMHFFGADLDSHYVNRRR